MMEEVNKNRFAVKPAESEMAIEIHRGRFAWDSIRRLDSQHSSADCSNRRTNGKMQQNIKAASFQTRHVANGITDEISRWQYQ